MLREIGLVAAIAFGWAGAAPTVDPDPLPSGYQEAGVGEVNVLYRKHGLEAMHQGMAPSCVGTATAKALEAMHGRPFSAEWIYAESREQFGFTTLAGSQCGWAAHIVRDSGALPATGYAALGHDLTTYSPGTANAWSRGPPAILKIVSPLYRSSGYHKIDTWEKLRWAHAEGMPVIVGSSVGFGPSSGQVRRSDGTLKARWWSRWRHAMVFIGVDDQNGKALILNSWGKDWVTGPKPLGDEPDGSFWAVRRDVNRMLKQGDAYAIQPIKGL